MRRRESLAGTWTNFVFNLPLARSLKSAYRHPSGAAVECLTMLDLEAQNFRTMKSRRRQDVVRRLRHLSDSFDDTGQVPMELCDRHGGRHMNSGMCNLGPCNPSQVQTMPRLPKSDLKRRRTKTSASDPTPQAPPASPGWEAQRSGRRLGQASLLDQEVGSRKERRWSYWRCSYGVTVWGLGV